mmetsp:Transcript_85550/g.169782  ORF Transcript_85550/g.169782 Transcript_85550/m.169782 type:complete len:236 (-) Transcript_85550:45-752(-)
MPRHRLLWFPFLLRQWPFSLLLPQASCRCQNSHLAGYPTRQRSHLSLYRCLCSFSPLGLMPLSPCRSICRGQHPALKRLEPPHPRHLFCPCCCLCLFGCPFLCPSNRPHSCHRTCHQGCRNLRTFRQICRHPHQSSKSLWVIGSDLCLLACQPDYPMTHRTPCPSPWRRPSHSQQQRPPPSSCPCLWKMKNTHPPKHACRFRRSSGYPLEGRSGLLRRGGHCPSRARTVLTPWFP